ncbi:ribonuclease HI family protein [Candidatus Woesearchaeota archaeon]|nr:ribonuclease HI family protein [Candidatus Woesearchaeota archaeon]
MDININADGGSRGNPGPAAIGIVATSENGKVLQECKEYIGITTNNVAEYKALIKSLEIAVKIGAAVVTIIMDSELVIKQMNGTYKVKAKHLREYYEKVKMLEKRFVKVVYKNVSRNEKTQSMADALVNEALNEKLDEK